MPQHDFDIANQGFPQFRTDLNAALLALATLSSGTSAPTTPRANMFWYNTTTNILSIRNTANTAWISLGFFDQGTGMFRPLVREVRAIDANGLAFQTDDGITRLFIDDAGRIGVGSAASAAAAFEVNSTTRGFRGPRMTTTQRLAIASPGAGLLVYDTTLNAYYVHNGTSWIPVGAGGGLFKGNGGENGINPGDIFRINEKTLTVNTTIDADENASCTGPLTVNTGVTLTVTSGGTLVIV